MTEQHPKLDRYLLRIEQSLRRINVGERAEIITQLKTQVLNELLRNPAQNIDQILQSIGEAEHVANRYLLERGLKREKTSNGRTFKWLTIGVLGTMSLFVVVLVFAITKLTPIISVDEKAGQVRILGGLIEVNQSEANTQQDTAAAEVQPKDIEVSGSQMLPRESSKSIEIPFSSAALSLLSSTDQNLRWTCLLDPQSKEKPEIKETDTSYQLNISKTDAARCTVWIPKDVKLSVNGSNGTIDLDAPQFDVDIDIKNGVVSIEPNHDLTYQYDLEVKNGKVAQGFVSSPSEQAKAIRVSVVNGSINQNTN